jgi:hypothetical protein
MKAPHCDDQSRLVVDLPSSLFTALESFSGRVGLPTTHVFSTILEGLPGLDPTEFGFFKEPKRERRSSVEFFVSASALFAVEQFSLWSGISCSGISRRVLYGLLFTQEIGISWDFEKQKKLLHRTQMDLPFA